MRLPSINFSFTRYFAIEPLLNVPAIRLQHRVAAAFMSVPLLGDAAVHFGAALGKTGDWAGRKIFRLAPSAHTLGDAGEHLKIAAAALLAAAVAPIAGLAAPRRFCQSLDRVFPRPPVVPPAPPARLAPPALPAASAASLSGRVVPFHASRGSSSSSSSSSSAPVPPALARKMAEIQKFVSLDYLNQRSVAQLRMEWDNLSLADKYEAVFLADQADHRIHQILAQVIYTSAHPMGRYAGRTVWPMSPRHLDAQMKSWSKDRPIRWDPSWPLFYHATQNREDKADIDLVIACISTSGSIQVRHQGAFPGAFVSTRPETNYGRHVFAFRQTAIQYLSKPMPNQATDQYSHWVGFSEDIPLSPETLACMFILDGSLAEVTGLQTTINTLFGSEEVPVFSLSKGSITEHSEGRMIPREWIEQLHREQRRVAS